MACRRLFIILGLSLAAGFSRADDLIYGYEGNVLPTDQSEGWQDGDPCIADCSQYVQSGSFVLRWEGGGQNVNIGYVIAEVPEEPPENLWVEWRFASNQQYVGGSLGCGARFAVGYRNIGEFVYMFGDAAFDYGAIHSRFGLEIDAFHTYRFETLDGTNDCVFVDGEVLFCDSHDPYPLELHLVWFGGGGCVKGTRATINRWDHIRYGTISFGERIIASDPASGVLDSADYPKLDRFTVTFDSPNYVHIDEITVEVTGGETPVVVKTGRLDNGDPETVEIILDRPLAVGETTTFTFDDGVATNVIEYTIVLTDACCLADGSCVITDREDCAAQGGEFIQGDTCTEAQACCYSEGDCSDLPPACCMVDGGTPGLDDLLCQGDPDGDNLDAACGDACPNDPFKTSPGQCGCGAPETDSDLDTIADCLDRCPGDDDRIDDDHNGIPDCLQFKPIPTTSEWGLVILTLTLLVAAKLCFGRRTADDSRISRG